MKGGAFTHFAFDPNPAVHFPDQLRGNCKAQAGTPVGACRRSVGLRERGENRPLFFSRNADAGVRDGKVQMPLPVAARLMHHRYDDLSPLRELDRVID